MPRPIAIIIRLAIAAAVVALSVVYYFYLVGSPPETPQRPAERTYPVAEATVLTASDYQVKLPSQGIVQPRVETQLTAEVSGKVSAIADGFLSGAAFEKGETLIELDSRDYQTAEQRAQAALTRMQTALQLAEAQTEKAREDWARLGLGGEPNDLALRLPQLKQAQADVQAAEADLAEARLNVTRCKIVAPYDGRVVQKHVDVGQVVNPGVVLGQIYSSEIFEVRLPLRNDQLAFLGFNDRPADSPPAALLKGERGPDDHWAATIERTDAAVDPRSRQLFVIAAIDTAATPDSPPLPSGTFVEAQIEGKLLSNVFVIPRKAIRDGNSVMEITEGKTIRFVQFEPIFEGDPEFVVASAEGELKEGTRISITPLPFVGEGDQVSIKGENVPPGRPGGGPGDTRPPLAGKDQGNGNGNAKGNPKGPPAAAGL